MTASASASFFALFLCVSAHALDAASCTTANDVAKDVDLTGKIVVMTGGDSGIGFAFASAMAGSNATLVLAVLDLASGSEAAANLTKATGNDKIVVLQQDLSSFASVRAFAKTVLSRYPVVDVLVNDAGIGANEHAIVTDDGFELIAQINYLGHFLLTQLLLPPLRAAQAPKVINVASGASYYACSWAGYDAECLDPNNLQKFMTTAPPTDLNGLGVPLTNYGITKLLQVYHMKELALREPAIDTYSIRPGLVDTPMTKDLDPATITAWCAPLRVEEGVCPLTPQQGAATPAFIAVTEPTGLTRGDFYYLCEDVGANMPQWASGVDVAAAQMQLFDMSSKWVGL